MNRGTIVDNGDYRRTTLLPEHRPRNPIVAVFWALVLYGCLSCIGGLIGLALYFLGGGA